MSRKQRHGDCPDDKNNGDETNLGIEKSLIDLKSSLEDAKTQGTLSQIYNMVIFVDGRGRVI